MALGLALVLIVIGRGGAVSSVPERARANGQDSIRRYEGTAKYDRKEDAWRVYDEIVFPEQHVAWRQQGAVVLALVIFNMYEQTKFRARVKVGFPLRGFAVGPNAAL